MYCLWGLLPLWVGYSGITEGSESLPRCYAELAQECEKLKAGMRQHQARGTPSNEVRMHTGMCLNVLATCTCNSAVGCVTCTLIDVCVLFVCLLFTCLFTTGSAGRAPDREERERPGSG